MSEMIVPASGQHNRIAQRLWLGGTILSIALYSQGKPSSFESDFSLQRKDRGMFFRCALVEKISQVLRQVSFGDGSRNHNVCGRATLPIRTDVVGCPVVMFPLDEDFSTEYVEPVLLHYLAKAGAFIAFPGCFS